MICFPVLNGCIPLEGEIADAAMIIELCIVIDLASLWRTSKMKCGMEAKKYLGKGHSLIIEEKAIDLNLILN